MKLVLSKRTGSKDRHEKVVAKTLRKRCEAFCFYDALEGLPSLRHEKQRSFLFSRADLLNRTDPDETVRNVEYML